MSFIVLCILGKSWFCIRIEGLSECMLIWHNFDQLRPKLLARCINGSIIIIGVNKFYVNVALRLGQAIKRMFLCLWERT